MNDQLFSENFYWEIALFSKKIIVLQPRDKGTMMVDKTMQISQNSYEKTKGYFIKVNYLFLTYLF